MPFGLKPSVLKSGSNFPWNKFLNKSRHFKVTVEGKLGDIAIHVDSSCKNMMIRVLGTIYFPSWSIFLSTSDAIIPRRKLKKRQRLKYRYQTVFFSLGPKNTVLNQSEIQKNRNFLKNFGIIKWVKRTRDINYCNNLFNYGRLMWLTVNFRYRNLSLNCQEFLELTKLTSTVYLGFVGYWVVQLWIKHH